MKISGPKLKSNLYLFVLAITLSSSSLSAQEDVFINEYLERLQKSKSYLILIAEMMPEEQYSFRATPESMSFEEHLMHICWAMDWHSQSLMGERPARDWETDTALKVDDKTKQQMIATVEETFDTTLFFIANFDTTRLEERLDYFGADRTKRQILLLLADHVTHHRAQMLVYLRLNGLQPPRYVLFQ
ncbi:DinB family protein [Croceiramulus getboli]|nr:DinB family protein [Flavobacteriaceae bacterium YJPT1-3]